MKEILGVCKKLEDSKEILEKSEFFVEKYICIANIKKL